MCGKDLGLWELKTPHLGSPPHVRERPCRSISLSTTRRITPACAGKTIPKCFMIQRFEDHPRMCGKDDTKKITYLLLLGSPPHVRERPPFLIGKSRYRGITPACAGKTHVRVAVQLEFRDHPRMCGKDKKYSGPIRPLSGSPPHVRERLDFIRSYRLRIGITPACAGKTADTGDELYGSKDHPRMCGKDWYGGVVVIAEIGSPPHVRERP